MPPINRAMFITALANTKRDKSRAESARHSAVRNLVSVLKDCWSIPDRKIHPESHETVIISGDSVGVWKTTIRINAETLHEATNPSEIEFTVFFTDRKNALPGMGLSSDNADLEMDDFIGLLGKTIISESESIKWQHGYDGEKIKFRLRD